ncbi:hypothetical protein [Endozoicomonas sp. GU-1]|uniref:hypothetical protein n=1 Tax=Endozoicomonas sp. GU-1 TaxID=3009078 RepID=UPI0022B2FE96|nr:hypothetical protein [Endozoicomonas sp. GU-1]WBA79599.1 hypothetical protein O2T12_14540 [Endozoicomonas sp. GU-1]
MTAKHTPKGGMCQFCAHVNNDCSKLPFEDMPKIGSHDNGQTIVVRCTDYQKFIQPTWGVDGNGKRHYLCEYCELIFGDVDPDTIKHDCDTSKPRYHNRDKYHDVR